MADHRYSLEKYSGPSSRHTCPSCHKSKQFTLYLDSVTGQPLGSDVGICNRRDGCGYHKTPRQFFQNSVSKRKENRPEPEPKIANRLVSLIPVPQFQKTLVGWENTSLGKYFISLFGFELAGSVMNVYMVGQSKNDCGKANIFWQSDIDGNIRTGKIMCYNEQTGKRRKEEGFLPSWVHKSQTIPQPFNLQQCFFGEHFLKQFPFKKVMIVESEKTALVAAIYMPEFIWLSTGGVAGVKWVEYDVNKVLRNRTVELFPDYGFFNKTAGVTCYDKWKEVAAHIRQRLNLNISVNGILEDHLKEEDREKGLDLSDFLLNSNQAANGINSEKKEIKEIMSADEWWVRFHDGLKF